jgi:ATP-dependent protease Clp ATPase subunit
VSGAAGARRRRTYVGEDVDNIILKLLQAAGGDLEKCQQGIIYIEAAPYARSKSMNPFSGMARTNRTLS